MQKPKDLVKRFILTDILRGEISENLKDDTPLMGSGVLDSLALLQIVQFLETKFSIKIDSTDLNVKNFGNLISIENFVVQKSGKVA
jgi:acyl carrier protein